METGKTLILYSSIMSLVPSKDCIPVASAHYSVQAKTYTHHIKEKC